MKSNDTPRVQPAIIRASHAHEVLGCGRTRLWELAKSPTFPRPIALGGRARGFLVDELVAWARERAERA